MKSASGWGDNPRPQLHQPDRLRQHRRRIRAESVFDDRLLPRRHRHRHQLLPRHPLPERRRNRYNRPIIDLPFQLFERHPEQLRRLLAQWEERRSMRLLRVRDHYK